MDNADAKEDNTFSYFTLARPRERNLDDRPRDIQNSASNVLLDVIATIVMLKSSTWPSSKGRTSGAQESISKTMEVNRTKSLWGGGQLSQSRYCNNRSSGWVCWPRHPLHRETFQPSYLPEIQIWLVSGYSRLIQSRGKNESLQHNEFSYPPILIEVEQCRSV